MLTLFYILAALCIALCLLGVFKKSSNTAEIVAAIILGVLAAVILIQPRL